MILAIGMTARVLSLVYGSLRIGTVDDAMREALSPRVAVVQGNIDQARKWDPAFQIGTTKKYLGLTMSAAARQPGPGGVAGNGDPLLLRGQSQSLPGW